MFFKLYFSKKVLVISHYCLLLISLIVNMRNLLSFFFALSMFNKSFITSNFIIFENLNILQIRLKKTNTQ